jgi:predicted nucleotidyltransferase
LRDPLKSLGPKKRRLKFFLRYNPRMATALELPVEEWKKYNPREYVRRRKIKTRAEVARRRRRALTVARKAVKILREKFGATEVILFGSLAKRGRFTLFSDIDLAARGIPPDKFYSAFGTLMELNTEFKVDLVDLADCSDTVRNNVFKDGKAL